MGGSEWDSGTHQIYTFPSMGTIENSHIPLEITQINLRMAQTRRRLRIYINWQRVVL